ncbi:MAG TPA: hypothetical protein VL181_09770 [Holophagaceae bacterium]|jgi:hypothetical protein|nr:hypothetical protein [Holophagaceae bacterium]
MGPRGRWIAFGLLAAGLTGFWLERRFPAPPSARLLIQADGPCAAGATALLSDLAELQNRWVVLPPGSPAVPRTQLLRLHLGRQSEVMTLQAELDGQSLPPQRGSPGEVFAGLARSLTLRPPGPALLPARPDEAWKLLDLAGRTQDEASLPLVMESEALAVHEPRCALARFAYANLLTRYLVEHLEADTLDAQTACERNFQEGLSDLPGYPRLTALFAIHLSDIGRQREAMDLLADALHRHPGATELLNSLAYAARTSGLLATADKALERRADLVGQRRGQASLADNALLYGGHIEAFASSVESLPPGPLRAFYSGYARLLQGDREGALVRFKEARMGGLGSSLFVRLAEVYGSALEGRDAEALANLDTLESERTQIHLPDGEFTFKVAEAYGFLGQPAKALDLAERASVQGFGCAPWFERAPFLADARKLPKWLSLDQHLRERQTLLADRFPPSRFGL